MSWSKITGKGKKPLGWWYNKLMCEYWYWKYESSFSLTTAKNYNKYLAKMCDNYKLSLYGEKL